MHVLKMLVLAFLILGTLACGREETIPPPSPTPRSGAVTDPRWSAPLVAVEIPPGVRSNGRGNLSIDPSGRAVIVWHVDEAIWAKRFDPASGWGVAELLDDAPSFVPAPQPVPRVNAYGADDAIVRWSRQDGDRRRIWTRVLAGGRSRPGIKSIGSARVA